MSYNIGIANDLRPGLREIIATVASIDAIEAAITTWAEANNWTVADFEIDTAEDGADAFLISKINPTATLILAANPA